MKVKVQWLLVALLVLALASSSGVMAGPGNPPGRTDKAPVLGMDTQNVIPGRYIVVFKGDTSERTLQSERDNAIKAFGGTVHYTYSAALKGFAASLPPQAVEALQNNPNVAYIEADHVISLDASQSPATWGLDRIDQRDLPLNNTYTYNTTGSGVRVYVIDTGIRRTHQEFGGRAYLGTDTIGDGQNGNDCHGHGTHVAATIGGSTYGVAKGVTLYAVRVLDCGGYGTDSSVVAGVNWVTQNRVLPAVANMSLGGGASTSIDTAVQNSIAAGVTYAIAAGNSSADACGYSPARVAAALTVGATDSTDARASYSNYGTCLDIFAPGTNVTSAWNTSDSATNTISGTSMATPHVAGVAALYLQSNPSASPATVASAIINGATTGKVTNPGTGSPNRLLYSLLTGGGGPTPTPTPSTCPPGTTTICSGASVPSGWIKTDDSWSPTRCGNPTYITYNVWTITTYCDKAERATMSVCNDAPTPAGWTKTNDDWSPTRCGHPSYITYNVKTIYKVAAVDTSLTMCSSSPMPTGWIKTNDNWSPTTCGHPSYITYNVWSIQRYDNKPVGSTMTVCADQATPSGWTVTGTSWSPTTCGHPSYITNNVKTIRRSS